MSIMEGFCKKAVRIWVFYLVLTAVKIGAQNVGSSCTPTDICNALLNEVCNGSVCACNTGYETIGGGSQCFAKDCGDVGAVTNGGVIYSSGTTFPSVAVYTCDTGYDVSGTNSRTCGSNAQWTGTAPTCELKECPVLTVPPQATINNVLRTYQQQVIFTCNLGYTLNGEVTLTCTSAGTWDFVAPTCDIVDCGALPTLTNGGVVFSNGHIYLSEATFTCQAGYDLTGVSATRTCGADELWTNANPTCTIKDCQDSKTLVQPTSGTISYSQGTIFESEATFTCNTGYDLLGTATIVCQQNGQWSTNEPTCQIKDCGGSLGTPTNGDMSLSTGTTYGSVATFTCDAGYELTGTSPVNCLADGNWDGPAPTCVIKDCGALAAVTNGGRMLYSSGTTFGSVAVYTCTTGYDVSGTNSRTCGSNAQWTGTAPTCEKTVATFSCLAGYDLTGSATRTCGADGLWTKSNPLCFIKDCGALAAATHGGVIYSSGTIFSSVAVYTCGTGYDVTGTQSRTCGADALWTGTAPTCEKKDCGSLTEPPQGSIDNTLTTYPEQVIFNCSTGYNLVGTPTLTCTSEGKWDNREPTCVIVDCGTVAGPTNGAVIFSREHIYASVATFSCLAGYDLIGSATRTCGADGLWTNSNPLCFIKDCQALATPTNGTIKYSAGTTFKSQATFICDTGYDLLGTATIVCQQDGTWSSPEPTCQIKDCGALAAATHGGVIYSSGTTFGSVAVYTCGTGYDVTGTQSRTCGADALWTGTAPTCEKKDCGGLGAPTNGKVTFSSGTVNGSTATFSCDFGYDLTGCSTRYCPSDGTWDGKAPTCVIKGETQTQACEVQCHVEVLIGGCIGGAVLLSVLTFLIGVYIGRRRAGRAEANGRQLNAPEPPIPLQTNFGSISTSSTGQGNEINGPVCQHNHTTNIYEGLQDATRDDDYEHNYSSLSN